MKNICIFLMGIDCSKKFLNKHIVSMVLVFSHMLVFDAFYFLTHQLFPQLTLILTLILLKWIVMVSIEYFQAFYFGVCLLVLHPIRLFEGFHASSHIAFIHTFIFYMLEWCTGIWLLLFFGLFCSLSVLALSFHSFALDSLVFFLFGALLVE